ncbi:hypothetical protein PCE1_001876 [Barthelona sp. PCE]
MIIRVILYRIWYSYFTDGFMDERMFGFQYAEMFFYYITELIKRFFAISIDHDNEDRTLLQLILWVISFILFIFAYAVDGFMLKLFIAAMVICFIFQLAMYIYYTSFNVLLGSVWSKSPFSVILSFTTVAMQIYILNVYVPLSNNCSNWIKISNFMCVLTMVFTFLSGYSSGPEEPVPKQFFSPHLRTHYMFILTLLFDFGFINVQHFHWCVGGFFLLHFFGILPPLHIWILYFVEQFNIYCLGQGMIAGWVSVFSIVAYVTIPSYVVYTVSPVDVTLYVIAGCFMACYRVLIPLNLRFIDRKRLLTKRFLIIFFYFVGVTAIVSLYSSFNSSIRNYTNTLTVVFCLVLYILQNSQKIHVLDLIYIGEFGTNSFPKWENTVYYLKRFLSFVLLPLFIIVHIGDSITTIENYIEKTFSFDLETHSIIVGVLLMILVMRSFYLAFTLPENFSYLLVFSFLMYKYDLRAFTSLTSCNPLILFHVAHIIYLKYKSLYEKTKFMFINAPSAYISPLLLLPSHFLRYIHLIISVIFDTNYYCAFMISPLYRSGTIRPRYYFNSNEKSFICSVSNTNNFVTAVKQRENIKGLSKALVHAQNSGFFGFILPGDMYVVADSVIIIREVYFDGFIVDIRMLETSGTACQDTELSLIQNAHNDFPDFEMPFAIFTLIGVWSPLTFVPYNARLYYRHRNVTSNNILLSIFSEDTLKEFLSMLFHANNVAWRKLSKDTEQFEAIVPQIMDRVIPDVWDMCDQALKLVGNFPAKERPPEEFFDALDRLVLECCLAINTLTKNDNHFMIEYNSDCVSDLPSDWVHSVLTSVLGVESISRVNCEEWYSNAREYMVLLMCNIVHWFVICRHIITFGLPQSVFTSLKSAVMQTMEETPVLTLKDFFSVKEEKKVVEKKKEDVEKRSSGNGFIDEADVALDMFYNENVPQEEAQVEPSNEQIIAPVLSRIDLIPFIYDNVITLGLSEQTLNSAVNEMLNEDTPLSRMAKEVREGALELYRLQQCVQDPIPISRFGDMNQDILKEMHRFTMYNSLNQVVEKYILYSNFGNDYFDKISKAAYDPAFILNSDVNDKNMLSQLEVLLDKDLVRNGSQVYLKTRHNEMHFFNITAPERSHAMITKLSSWVVKGIWESAYREIYCGNNTESERYSIQSNTEILTNISVTIAPMIGYPEAITTRLLASNE